MGKKSNPTKQEPDVKKNKVKFKEMFNELQTHEEHRVNRKSDRTKNQNIIEEQDSSMSAQPEEQDNHCPFDKICENVSKLIAKNKVTVKNAFQVPIIDLEKMVYFQSTDDNEYAWKRLSSTLENDYKIYGYRVDATHSDAFRILNSMARHEQKPQDEVNKEKEETEKQEELFSRQNLKVNPDAEAKHLEKHIKNLNVELVQYSCGFNPVLERTKRKFDQNGLKGLLLNSISINQDLELALNTEKVNKESFKAKNQKVFPVQSLKNINLEDFQIMSYIDAIKITNKVFPKGQSIRLQDLWEKIENGDHNDRESVIKLELPNEGQMIEENNIYQEKSQMEEENQKAIEMMIKTKHKKILTNADIRAEEELWMTDEIRKLLGGPTTTSKTLSNKIQSQQDFIEFEAGIQERYSILSKEADKNQHNEEIEDKFLLPLRYVSTFKLQQRLSLRHEQQVLNPEMPAYEVIEQERQLIDVRRQQTSIRQTKEQLKNLLINKEQSSFKDLFKEHQKVDKDISPALCFLTLLHLANENNLSFYQESQDNFMIK